MVGSCVKVISQPKCRSHSDRLLWMRRFSSRQKNHFQTFTCGRRHFDCWSKNMSLFTPACLNLQFAAAAWEKKPQWFYEGVTSVPTETGSDSDTSDCTNNAAHFTSTRSVRQCLVGTEIFCSFPCPNYNRYTHSKYVKPPLYSHRFYPLIRLKKKPQYKFL